jgi:ferritin
MNCKLAGKGQAGQKENRNVYSNILRNFFRKQAVGEAQQAEKFQHLISDTALDFRVGSSVKVR